MPSSKNGSPRLREIGIQRTVRFGREKDPIMMQVCFHAEQCAEEYLKGYLQSKRHRFSKTHNLLRLMELCSKYDPSFEFHSDILEQLNQYAVIIRYPGEEADKLEAKLAVNSLKIFRAFVRDIMNLIDN